MKLLNELLRGVVQGIPIVGIAGSLRDADDQPVSQGRVAAAVVHDATLRRKRSAASIVVRILLPIVRIFQRIRIPLIKLKFRRRQHRSFRGYGLSGHRLFHYRQGQHFAFNGFKFRGIALGGWRDSAQLVDFLVHAFQAVFGVRMVGEKLRRILPFRLGFELLEKLRHGTRVVAAVVEDLRAHDIRLRFRASRVTQQHSAGGKRTQLRQ